MLLPLINILLWLTLSSVALVPAVALCMRPSRPGPVRSLLTALVIAWDERHSGQARDAFTLAWRLRAINTHRATSTAVHQYRLETTS